MTEEMAAQAPQETPLAPVEAPAETPAPAPAPKRLRLNELKPGTTTQGTVKNIAQFGAFIDIGAEQDGLVHISELSEDRVRRVEDVVKVGQQVEVTILDVDRNRKRISLSMKPRYEMDQATTATVDDDEPVLTPMQLAFQRAEEKRKAQEEKQRKDRDKTRRQQDDILSRTLQQHRKS